ncbi:MAG: LamG-like jellyroll fold domain-containing protein [Planctomycetota bacterium]
MKKTTILLIFLLLLATFTTVSRADFIFDKPTKLGQMVNSWSDDYSPCISADGLSLYFASTRFGGYGSYDIWICRRQTIEDEWGEAENLGERINSSDEDTCPAVSADGLELYFASFRSGGLGGADIWVAKRSTTSEPWGLPENLDNPVNSTADEVTPSLSADGLELYFTLVESGTEGGEAQRSFCVTKRQSLDAPWESPKKLGQAINSGTCKWNPAVSSDGRLLFYCDYWDCSMDPNGSAVTDLWLAMRATKDTDWGESVNLGVTINTAFAEDSPMISPDGTTLYFSSDSDKMPEGWNNYDIWQASIVPVVDLDDNGEVGESDRNMILEAMGTDNRLCDIGPMPWGDGIVDEVDLEILTNSWGTVEGLVAYWKLDEAEGSIAYDSIGIYDANVFGEPIWQPDGGMVGGALLFDGIDDYIDMPFIFETEELPSSIFAWVKGEESERLQVIVSVQKGLNLLSVHPDGRLVTSRGGFPIEFMYSKTIITDGQWHNLGFAWDGSIRSIYVDGVEEGWAFSSNGPHGSLGLRIGGSWGLDFKNFWSGFIDDVRLYDRATQPEQQRFTGPGGRKDGLQ